MLLEGVLASAVPLGGVPRRSSSTTCCCSAASPASGLAMFVLARHITGATVPALVAAAVFTMAPYRIEHFMHLELQWTMWMPLTLWAFHRAIEDGDRGAAGCSAASFSGCRSYRACTTACFSPSQPPCSSCCCWRALLVERGRRCRASWWGALVAVVLTAPYALPYLTRCADTWTALPGASRCVTAQRRSTILSARLRTGCGVGLRRPEAAPNGICSPAPGGLVLAAAAFGHRPRRLVFIYVAIAALSIELSFGLNGRVYSWLFDHVDALQGFRAPARFAVIACCAIAVLAGFGANVLVRRLVCGRRRGGQGSRCLDVPPRWPSSIETPA